MKKRYTIFLVEDDINFGTVLRSCEMQRFTVVWVSNGEKAIQSFQNIISIYVFLMLCYLISMVLSWQS